MPARPRELLKLHDLHEVEGFEDLWECKVCHCAEASLLDSCPGYPLNGHTQDDIMEGKVVDLLSYKERRILERGWNY